MEVACSENRHKSFAFIATLLGNGPIFMLGGGPKAHEVLPENWLLALHLAALPRLA
jgi:hypothetical protein